MPVVLRIANDRYMLNGVRSRLGRSPQCELPLPGGPESVVSWEHACLEHAAGAVVLADLGSTNGTYFNGVKLEPRRPVTVTAGDRFRFGLKGPEFVVESVTPLPELPPPPPPPVLVVTAPPPPPPPVPIGEPVLPEPRRTPLPTGRRPNHPTATQLHRAVEAIRGERRTATLIAVIGVSVCIVAVGVVLALNVLKKKPPEVVLQDPPPPPPPQPTQAERYDKLMKSMVWVEAEKVVRKDGKTYVGMSRGSGALIEVGSEKYILTASHVIEGANRLLVAFPRRKPDGKQWELDPKPYRANKWQSEATVARNARNLDLALLEARNLPEGVTPLRLAATSPKVGEGCATVGNQSPEGESATAALWAFKRGEIQSVDYKRYFLGPIGWVQSWMIQTSIIINQGDSGGVLVNDKDEVIGVNSNGKIEIEGGNIYNFQIEWRVIDAFVRGQPIPGPP